METQASAEQLATAETAPTNQPEPAPPLPPRVIARARWRRVLGWFWCSREFSEVRTALAQESEARRGLRARCKSLMTFAGHASEPTLSDGGSNPDAVACELYRQAVYWALLALRSEEPGQQARPRFAELTSEPWARALLGKAVTNASPVRDLLSETDFIDISERTPEEQSQALFVMRDTAERLLQLLEGPENALNSLWLRRLVRTGVIFFVLGCLAIGVLVLRDLREQHLDLAHNKSWRASSSAAAGCPSPQQDCDDSPAFFFHTSEEKDPWVEIDLGAPVDFSAIRLINRRDAFADRASPLVVEIGADQSKWKQVASHEGTFKTWKVDVGKQRARYVRVRAVGFKMLHLAAVRVLP